MNIGKLRKRYPDGFDAEHSQQPKGGRYLMLYVLQLVTNLLLGGLVLMPFVGGIGFAWIDHWYNKKSEFLLKQAMALTKVMKTVVEQTKNEDTKG